MAENSFGKALGELILQKRRAMGLTQLQLAEDAFSDSTKVRRISDLEKGLVANPHPKTIDPIISVLKISAEEVEECAKRAGGKIDPDLDRAYREARNLIEALAYQFEHTNPEASFADLDHFLREKATEWRYLRERLDAIDGADEEITRAKQAAAEALANGKLDEVDAALAALEERFQEQRTLIEIRKQSEIRLTRGDTCLIKEDVEGAFGHYLQAARFFQPFSEAEMARTLDETAHRIYETSLRMLKPRFWIGIQLLEELLKLGVLDVDSEWRTATQYRLGLLYRNAASHASGNEQENLLQHAYRYSRLASEQLTESSNAFKIVSAKICLANCLLDLGKLHRDQSLFAESIFTLQSARVISLEEDEAKSLLCHVSNSLGGALLAASIGDNGIPKDAAIEDALEHFSEAIINAERFNNPDVWGAAHCNRAQLLAAKARQEDRDATERKFLFIQSISSYHAAIETYPETLFPDHCADAHFELANVLFHFSLIVPDDIAETYMFRAVQYFDISGAIYAAMLHKREAECLTLSGSLIARHARLKVAEKPELDFKEAIRRFEAALNLYKQNQNSERVAACKRAITTTMQELAQLSAESLKT